mgnify:CR=1 FL=1
MFFFDFVAQEDSTLLFNAEDYKRSERLLKLRLKSVLAQDLWGANEMFQVYNVGSNEVHSVNDVLGLMKHIVDYNAPTEYIQGKPSMIPTRRIDSNKIKENLGWESKTPLEVGTNEFTVALLQHIITLKGYIQSNNVIIFDEKQEIYLKM